MTAGGARGVRAVDPALFADAVLTGLAAGESAEHVPLSADGLEPGGSVSMLRLPDTAHSRAAFALKRRFGDDEVLFRSVLARFRALMDLFSRNALARWSRPREGGRSALHPAVIDVASCMRLSDNGRFAPRKFDRAVELAAREHYRELAGWEADVPRGQ